jgi:hypothetical protein
MTGMLWCVSFALQLVFNSNLQAALSRNREQLAVLQEQLQRLAAALKEADDLDQVEQAHGPERGVALPPV